MSNTTETQPTKLSFWKRLALIFEAMEKTETDYLRDEIVSLRKRQSKLEQELSLQMKPESNLRLLKMEN